MDYPTLRAVLAQLSCLRAVHVHDLATRTGLSSPVVVGSLWELQRRGLARVDSTGHSLPAGLTEPRAQLLLLIGERGAMSSPEIASRLSRPDPEVRADLRALEAAGRLQESAGAWELVAAIPPATVLGIHAALMARSSLRLSLGREEA